MYSKLVLFSQPERMAQSSWFWWSQAIPAIVLQLRLEFKGLPAAVPDLNALHYKDHTANTLSVLVWSFKPKML